MWLVNAALKNPYVVYVGMLLVIILGLVAYQRTPTDILPHINMPVVVVFASYRGMPAPDMEKSVTSVLERALTRCDHLEHMESRSLLGIGILKVFFRPQVDPDVAASQVISLVNGELQNLPPGMLPPSILKFDASSIPVGNLIISSPHRDDKELLDIADHQLRDELATVEGLASAPVFGGVFRQVQIYIHPRTLEALKLSPMNVARIVNSQSQIIPTGEIRIGSQTYYVASNSMVATPKDFEKIPLYSDGRKIVYLGDVAQVVDGTRWRTNTVHKDGRRAVYMPLLRQGGASAVRVVDRVKAFLPELHKRGTIPDDVQVELAFDQSQYVRDALGNLRLEGFLGAVLAALVVMLFLGSLRCTWIVMLSIPLSFVAAFAGLYFTGHTLNLMTLGGLALILGRLVDDSIVDVENTMRHLEMNKTPLDAARDSAAEISVPVLMATVTTVIVFLPLVFMTGVGKDLFTPLAVSATLAMAASYIVSRTVSPLYCSRYLQLEHERERFPRWLFWAGVLVAAAGLGPSVLDYLANLLDNGAPAIVRDALEWPDDHLSETGSLLFLGLGAVGAVVVLLAVVFRWAPAFNRLFEKSATLYEKSLRLGLHHRYVVLGGLGVCVVPAVWCFLHLGQELFPEVDTSEFTLHLRLKGGPRVEATEDRVLEIQNLLRDGYTKRFGFASLTDVQKNYLIGQGYARVGDCLEKALPPLIPAEDLKSMLANIGVSSRWSAVYTSNNGPHAAFLRVQLRSGFAGRKVATLAYVEKLREVLEERYPGDDFFFETGGIIRRILSGGEVAPIEVQIAGRDLDSRKVVAQVLNHRISRLPQVKDTYLPQAMDLPQLSIEVDRVKAARLQLTQADAIQNVIAALMSSAQLAPNFWIDPQSGNPYIIGVQYPEHLVQDIQTLENVPLTVDRTKQARTPLLRDVADIVRTQAPVEIYHYNADRVSQLFLSVGNNNLAGVAAATERILAQLPLNYALAKLSRESLHDYAVKVFPRGKGDPAADPALAQLLQSLFLEEEEFPADEFEEKYGVSVESLDLTKNEVFKDRLEAYTRKGRQAVRDEIHQVYGVDPLPLRLPPNVRVSLHGEIARMRESFAEIGFTLVLAVVLVYLIMAGQFSSWLDPLIMVVAAPLGLIGVVLALWLTGSSINVQSFMGVLMMIGISVSNSVLLIDFANQRRAEGGSALEAIVRAARVRLRPILMTTVAAVAALLPMAIHLHSGDEMNLPLARAVIGGLTGSTLLTLFVVPVLYVLLKRSPTPVATLTTT